MKRRFLCTYGFARTLGRGRMFSFYVGVRYTLTKHTGKFRIYV